MRGLEPLETPPPCPCPPAGSDWHCVGNCSRDTKAGAGSELPPAPIRVGSHEDCPAGDR